MKAVAALAFAVLLSVFAAGQARSAAPATDGGDDSQCLPFTRALEKAGETACITGKVVEVHVARSGMTYLNFCRDERDCSFAVAVAPADARRFGNLQALKNREIRITGKVFRRGHLAEITWRSDDQLLVAVDDQSGKKEKTKK